ncbi:hypothetical protein, partial [Actinocorallia lasiicapitis]
MKHLLVLALLAPSTGPVWDTSLDLTRKPFLINTIEATAKNDAWAFGGAKAEHGRPVALRWDGRSWKRFALPKLTGEILQADSSSPRNVWAVGAGDGGSYLLRFDGSRWKTVKTWKGRFWAGSLEVFGPKDVWLTLEPTGGTASRALRFDGRSWKTVKPVVQNVRLAGTSSRDLWAIGGTRDGRARLLHRTAKGWQRIVPKALPRDILPKTVPNEPAAPGTITQEVRLTDVTAISRRDVRIAGEIWWDRANGLDADPVDKVIPFALRWDGHRWRRENTPTELNLAATLALSPDGRGGSYWSLLRRAHDNAGPGALPLTA